jgi:phosphatidylinositol alpha-1,6-mannosyltransferase
VIHDDHSVVAPLGVDSYWFETNAEISGARGRLGIPSDRQIILSVSRLDERKGHRHMLAALSRLRPEQKLGAVYVVVGGANNPDYAEELKDMAMNTGLPVIFTGALPRDEVRELYAAASVFLLLGEERSDKVEGFGLVFLEAAAQGVPSVASPIGGVPEVVLHEQTGLLTDYRDPDAAARAIGNLLSDTGYRSRLGAAARDWARSLTWRRCAEVTFA